MKYYVALIALVLVVFATYPSKAISSEKVTRTAHVPSVVAEEPNSQYAAAPAGVDPLSLRGSCDSDSRPIFTAFLSAVRMAVRARESGTTAIENPLFLVSYHSTPAPYWIELAPKSIEQSSTARSGPSNIRRALAECVWLSVFPRDRAEALNLGIADTPTLSYTPRIGLYLVVSPSGNGRKAGLF